MKLNRRQLVAGRIVTISHKSWKWQIVAGMPATICHFYFEFQRVTAQDTLSTGRSAQAGWRHL